MHSWEQRKLGDLIEDNIIIEQSDGNHGELYPRSDEFTDAGIPYIAASAISSSGDDIDFNLVKYLPLKRAEQFRKGVAQNGDILLAHNATVGPCLQLSMEYDFAILSTSLTLFRINENKMNSKFFLQMLRSDLFQNQLFKYMKQTTRSQVPILTQRKLEVCYPNNTQDQELIGTYLSNLDHLITLHQRKCDETKTLKKYMLQKMFPQNGEKVPEIRFDGFTEDWEQRKFGDYNDLMTGYPFESDKFSEDGIKLVRGMNVKRGYLDFSGDICVKWNSCVGLEKFLLKDGDILIQMDGALIGKSYAKIKENQLPALLVQRVTRARTNNKFASQDFMYQTIQRDFLRYIEMNKTETAVPHLSLNDIRNFEIMVPCLAEQKKIGEYFDSLDNLITLHQRKCDELRSVKKFMLQNMFI